MTISPALTWLHLFPSDVGCDAPDAPAWFRASLGTRADAGRRRVLVAWERAYPEFAGDLSAYFGFAAVNCRGLSADSLRAAGFRDVRRFAVLPTLAEARWFIPLDAPALASAAFCLYTPTRLSARFKRCAARLIARTRLPVWYTDQIWIAQRARPPLEDALQSLFPGTEVRLALSSGAPEPARNRKASAAVLGPRGQVLAFAKLAGSPLSRSLVRREAEFLSALETVPGQARPAPRLLFEGEVEGTTVAVQSPLPGRPAGPRLTVAHRRFLESLRLGPRKPATATALVAALPSRLAALATPRPALETILDDLRPELDEILVPRTIVHGDFAPWNLRARSGDVTAFDWEYAEPDGLPLIDELHHQLQVGYQIDGWTVPHAREYLAGLAASRPLGFRSAQVAVLQVVYLLDILVRMLSEGYDDDPMVDWYYGILISEFSKIREVVAT